MMTTVNHETGEIVPAENMELVRALPAEQQAIALTGMLTEARAWLAHALEASDPMTIANFKAQMATMAEAAKQLKLSRGLQLDATEMLRIAEREVGVSIRKGQADGSIRIRGQRANPQGDYERTRFGKTEVVAVPDDIGNCLPGVTDIAPDFYNNGMEIGHMAAATDEQFQDALSEAKAEGNLSRANVVRKVKGYVSGDLATRDQRADAIRDLAEKGWSSHQMTDRIGISEESIRKIGRDYGIPIPADRALHRQRRVNPNDIVDNLVIGLEGSVMSLDLVDLADLDRENADYWATSLIESLQKLNRFAKQIKEIAHVQS